MASTNKGRHRVLVADDDPRLLNLIGLYLDLQGYEVKMVGNGQEALDAAKAAPPDLIILDIMMPVMDGLEACRQIRASKECAQVPVVVLTALGNEADNAKAAGANAFVSKPFDLPELAAAVSSHMLNSA